MAENIFCKKSSLTVTGNKKLLSELFLKISAKKLLTTTSNPASLIAQAACSLDEPQPKFFPASKTLPLYVLLFKTKSCFGWFSSSLTYLQSRKRFFPNPSLLVAFKKRAGMIWSVSTFSILSGTVVDLKPPVPLKGELRFGLSLVICADIVFQLIVLLKFC